MKEERSVLRDIIGTDQPKDASKSKKYVQIAFAVIFMVFFAILIVAAVIHRYGS